LWGPNFQKLKVTPGTPSQRRQGGSGKPNAERQLAERRNAARERGCALPPDEDVPFELRVDADAAPGNYLPALARLLLGRARRREAAPDYLGHDDLLALDLSEEEARAVLAGQPQVARDEVEDRLNLYRQEIANRGRPP
jgi:hypothetical protein